MRHNDRQHHTRARRLFDRLLNNIASRSQRRSSRSQPASTTQFPGTDLETMHRRLKEAQELAGIGYLEYTYESGEVFWSEEIYRIFGYEPGEVQPSMQIMRDQVTDDDKRDIGSAIREARRTGVPQAIHFHAIRPAGEQRAIKGRVLIDPSCDKGPPRIVSTLQDITEQHEVEEQLRRHRARLAAGQRIARMGTWQWDLLSDELWWSAEVDQLLDLDPSTDQATFQEFLTSVHPEDRQRVETTVAQALTQLKPIDLEFRRPRSNGELRVIHTSGEIFVDEEGTPERLVGALQDITERKQEEDEIRRTRAALAAGQRLVQLGTWDWDVRAGTVWWSEEVDRIFEFETGSYEPSFEMFLESLHPDDRQPSIDAIQAALSDGTPLDMEARVPQADGSVRIITSVAEVVPNDDGEPIRMIGAIQDITERKRIEDELVRHRASLIAGQRIARMGTWHWDLVSDTLWWSEEISGLLGAPEGIETTLESFLDHVHPADRQSIIDAVTEARTIGTPINLEIRVPLEHDGNRVLQSSGEVFVDEAGHPYRMIGIIQDITQRKDIEDQLRESQASLAAGQEIAGLGTWTWNIQDGSVWWSDQLFRILGYEPHEIPATYDAFMDRLHPDERQRTMDLLNASVETRTLYENEMRFTRVGESEERFAASRAEVFYAEDGTPESMIGAIQDITDRKHVEDELRRNRATLSAGQQLARMGTWDWDLQTGAAWLSEEVYEVMGIDRDNLESQITRGASPFDLGAASSVGDAESPDEYLVGILPEDRRMVVETIRTAIVQNRPYDMELRFLGPIGTVRYAQARGEPITDSQGRPIRLIGVIQDITERKKAEQDLAVARDQALHASRLKSEFLATMSHEIRTPMNGIIGMLDLVQDTKLDSQQRDYINSARESAGALLSILNDILDFSRIEAGKLSLERLDFNPTSVVEGAAEVLAPQAQENNTSLMSYVDDAIPPMLRGDANRLRQILINLVSNGVKFSRDGEVTVRATRESTLGDHITLRFEVIDNGIGISPEVQARLFQPFSQADATTTRTYGGTGLGLAICKRLVDLMGGEIGVESVEGEGSTFWATIPFERSPLPPQESTASSPIDLAGVRVLIVEGHETTREILHSYVVSWGMMNGNTADANEALEMLRDVSSTEQEYDVAIIGTELVSMDATELATRIQADPHLRNTSLVLLTDVNERRRGEVSLRKGFTAYLTKPVRRSQLFDAIAGAISRRDDPEHEAGIETETAPAPTAPATRDDGQMILLAEDNPVNQKVARLQLQKLGYQVTVANNGTEVLEAMQSPERFALILMDVQMPEMDGFTATRLIRKAEVNSSTRTPIIAMTANAMEGDREECLAAGMDDYLSKPVNAASLRAMMEQWMPSDDA